MIGRLLLFIRSIKYLKKKQILFKFWYIFKIKYLNSSYCQFELRKSKNKNLLFLEKNSSIISNYKFKFINLTFKIDNNWQTNTNDKLWLYNLHYFDYLNSKYSNKYYLKKLINDWINLDINHKILGYDSYPLSLRIVNWIKFFINNKINNPKYNFSLFNQIIILNNNLEYHLLGNHYFANLKALIFGCIYFRSKLTDEILANSLIKFENELKIQILNDGGHAEFSPMYHSIILEDLLDIIALLNYFEFKIAHNLLALINKKVYLMLNWLFYLSHPNGVLVKFNDTTEGVSKSIHYLEEFYKKFFKINYTTPKNGIIDFKNTGYVILKQKNLYLAFKYGNLSIPHLSGHTHSDTFSFELSYKKCIFITNGGISTYNTSPAREYQRSSFNHSTIIVNNRNSAEVWKSFRLARRPKVGKLSISKSNASITLSNYFEDFKSEYTHFRDIQINNNIIALKDRSIDAKVFMARLIIYPKIKIKVISSREIILYRGRIKIKVLSKFAEINLNKFLFNDQFNSHKATHCIDVLSYKNFSRIELILL